MAIENALEYTAQSQGASRVQSQGERKNVLAKSGKMQTQQSTQTAGTKSVSEVGTTGQKDSTGVDEMLGDASGVCYDVSKRTSDVAAWYQEFLRREQETQLALLGIAEEEAQAAKERKKDSVQEALDKAETLVESLKRMVERMREQQKVQKEEKENSKKKLSYSYRRISNAIGTAKTSMQASNALSSATANLSSIRRKAVSGEYEEKDIEIALQHANKMVRVARKKVANLKSEALQQKRNRAKESQKQQQVNMVYQKPKRQKAEKELQQLESELKSRENQKKNANRRDEDMDLMQADMQYLRRKIDLLKSEGISLSPQNQQVIDDMAAAAIGFVTLGMKEQAVEASQGNQSAVAQAASSSASMESTGSSFEAMV